ncbi:cardiolipin synthase [Alkalicoccus chagannorensis]|uniref:cardiolipin synthase n=1 Tax=Alkalicoccus chagannorensis TaxID=427072 RepID=UPI00054DA5C1|nr:cardiolipin synthase [Alkalicoccus chagannorensis]
MLKKLRWAAAILTAWISLDLYLGKRAHARRRKTFAPPEMTSGHVEFFQYGDALFAHILKRVRAAEDHIYMHFYIFRNDDAGRDVLDALKLKAQEGVTVKLLIDYLGARLPLSTRRELKHSGVDLEYTQKPTLPFLFYSLNERNHRKVTVIDGDHAYVGGFNVGDEYTGNDPEVGMWRDYHLYVTGLATSSLARQFARDWYHASGEKLHLPVPEESSQEEMPLQLLSTDGNHVPDHFEGLFAEAESSVFIGTPYYIPDSRMHEAILHLRRRGVSVQLLFPKHPDHPLVRDGAMLYMKELLDAGVDVRQFQHGFYHAKVVLVDQTVLDIGTANYDMRSFYINHEVNCTIREPAWVEQVARHIEHDFHVDAEKITYEMLEERNAWDKTREQAARLLSSWM